jgi:hypothetical protein
MNSKQWIARAEAYEECATHLGLAWTEDAEEREQGKILARWFREKAIDCQACSEKAAKRDANVRHEPRGGQGSE